MKKYGLDANFAALAEECGEQWTVGRVIAQERGSYQLMTDLGEVRGVVSGKFQYDAVCVSDFPAVGDFVMAEVTRQEDLAVIHRVLERKSVFVRKAAGTDQSEQVIAANVDTVFICMSLNQDYNVRRLERYLAAVYDSGAMPVIVFTKADLCDDVDAILAKLPAEISLGTAIVMTSALWEDGIKSISPYLEKGKTVAFVGSSGVGKSTLINKLTGTKLLRTGGIRKDDKGHHTTTHRELICLESGALVMDTPGMRELGMWDNERGIDTAFADIEQFAMQCKFHDCTHTNEPHCRVQEAIANGELSRERLQAYLKLRQENEYAQDSRSYLMAKQVKFKKIAKINKANGKR